MELGQSKNNAKWSPEYASCLPDRPCRVLLSINRKNSICSREAHSQIEGGAELLCSLPLEAGTIGLSSSGTWGQIINLNHQFLKPSLCPAFINALKIENNKSPFLVPIIHKSSFFLLLMIILHLKGYLVYARYSDTLILSQKPKVSGWIWPVNLIQSILTCTYFHISTFL